MKFTPIRLLRLLILINCVAGWIIAPDFGRTTDEGVEYLRATASLRAYTPGSIGEYSDNDIPVASRFYGTAMTMLAHAAEQIFQPILETESGVLIHYSYFVIFQIGIISIFFLTKKFTGEWTAFLIALLYASQPLLFGHAFNNPKDTPLLSIFLAAVASGVYMVDKLADGFLEEGKEEKASRFDFLAAWRSVPPSERKKFFRLQLVWLIVLGTYLLVLVFISQFVTWLLQTAPESVVGRGRDLFLSQQFEGNPEPYILKAERLVDRFFIGLAGLVLLLMLVKIIQTIQPLKNYLIEQWVRPILQQFRPRSIAGYLTSISLLGAAIIWGLSISTRVLGLFSGGMVGLYLLFRMKKNAVAPGVVYTIFGLASAYATWPQFWVNGLSIMFSGLKMFSSFFWDNPVLYQGLLYPSSQLPRSYLPFFLVTQFTAPLILLAVLGIGISIFRLRAQSINWPLFIIVVLWLALPLIYVLVTHPKIYNNARQFLFITPPIFILAGIGFEYLWRKYGNQMARGLLALAVLLPGFISLVQLHPYQYIYFNEFVGGVDGAFRKYELDYNSTSATEAIKYLNQIAPKNSTVVFWGIGQEIDYYAREDLEIIKQRDVDRSISEYDFAIILSQFNADLHNLASRPAIYTVERQGALLAVVKEIHADP